MSQCTLSQGNVKKMRKAAELVESSVSLPEQQTGDSGKEKFPHDLMGKVIANYKENLVKKFV